MIRAYNIGNQIFSEFSSLTCILAVVTTTLMTTRTFTRGPLLTESVSVVPGVTYGVQLKLMMGDLDSTSEYADLSIDGQSTGRCGDSSHSLRYRSCEWLPCDSGLSDLTSANSVVSISLQYNSGYDASLSGPCTVNGTSSVYAAAILTLSPKGIFLNNLLLITVFLI